MATKDQDNIQDCGFSLDDSHPEYQICLNTVEKAMKNNQTIQKLVDAIEELGCKLPDSFIACRLDYHFCKY